MRTVQEIFNVVIAEGYYGEFPFYTDNPFMTGFMCFALDRAYQESLITFNERDLAKREISRYLKALWGGIGGSNLKRCLVKRGLPSTSKARLAIYKDWKNRPLPN